jgi:hypothetical protein
VDIAELLPRQDELADNVVFKTRRLDRLLEKARKPTSTNAVPMLPPAGEWSTRVALHGEALDAAEDLVRRRYAWRGYRLPASKAIADMDCGLASRCVTLVTENHGRVLGTLTVRADSLHGLLAEKSYASEIERLRDEGHRVGELGRLAFEEGADWKTALDALVQSAYVVTRLVYRLTDVVIEVNPRHSRFYQRVFGFVIASAQRMCMRVGAPSVLMQLDLEQFGRRLQSAGTAGESPH